MNRHRSVVLLAVIYLPGQPGMGWIFMEEFDFFIESFSNRNGKLENYSTDFGGF